MWEPPGCELHREIFGNYAHAKRTHGRTNDPMTAVPIPLHELKGGTWYYGVRCACTRLLALVEDCFGGRGDDEHRSSEPFEIWCDCGRVTKTQNLQKFKTP